jgi:hypothetical protein
MARGRLGIGEEGPELIAEPEIGMAVGEGDVGGGLGEALDRSILGVEPE